MAVFRVEKRKISPFSLMLSLPDNWDYTTKGSWSCATKPVFIRSTF